MTSEGQEISWDSIGVAFSIPPGAVPEGEESQLTVRPCLTGPFEPPDQYQVTSPLYHVSSSCKFSKDIEIVLYHNVNLENDDDCKRMTFFSAADSPTPGESQPQYQLKVQEGGSFHANEKFGTIRLRQPSDLAIGINGPKPRGRVASKALLVHMVLQMYFLMPPRHILCPAVQEFIDSRWRVHSCGILHCTSSASLH